jgi:NMD protein affecting ribosome stability and mRNA decay
MNRRAIYKDRLLEFTPGDLVVFEHVKSPNIESATLNELGVVIDTDNGRYVGTVYKVYWFKTKKMALSLACHLRLLYTMEET